MIDVLENLNKKIDEKQKLYMEEKEKRDTLVKDIEQTIKDIETNIRRLTKPSLDLANKNVRSLNDDKERLCKNLVKLGTFDVMVLGEIIARIIKFYEGEDFYYVEKTLKTTVIYSNKTFDEHFALILDGYANDLLTDEYIEELGLQAVEVLNELVLQGHALVLTRTFNELKTMETLSNDFCTNTVKPKIDFGRFSYVDNYLSTILSFGMIKSENIDDKPAEITEDELKELEILFLRGRRKEIEDRYSIEHACDDMTLFEEGQKRRRRYIVLDEYRRYIK